MNSFKKYLFELAEEFSYIVEISDKEGNKIIENKSCNVSTINFSVVYSNEKYNIKLDKRANTSRGH